MIEGFAAGIPAIVTECGGPEYLVEATHLGRIVPRGNALQLADAMSDVIANHGHFDRRAIESHYTRHFGQAAAERAWKALYDEVDRVVLRERGA